LEESGKQSKGLANIIKKKIKHVIVGEDQDKCLTALEVKEIKEARKKEIHANSV